MLNIIYIFLTISFAYSQCDYDNELQCNLDGNCEWHGNINYMNCSDFGNSSSCANYSEYGCSWEFSWGGWQNYGSSCVGGAFQIDSGYCDEIPYEMGDVNGDNLINIQDIIIITELITDGEYNSIVDMNHDESVDVLDIVLIISIILDN